MEPLVVCALGVVCYYCYLAVRDFIADLHEEGIVLAFSSRKLLGCLKGALGGLKSRRGSARRARVVDHSLSFWHGSQALPYLGLQQSAGRRFHRVSLSRAPLANGR